MLRRCWSINSSCLSCGSPFLLQQQCAVTSSCLWISSFLSPIMTNANSSPPNRTTTFGAWLCLAIFRDIRQPQRCIIAPRFQHNRKLFNKTMLAFKRFVFSWKRNMLTNQSTYSPCIKTDEWIMHKPWIFLRVANNHLLTLFNGCDSQEKEKSAFELPML